MLVPNRHEASTAPANSYRYGFNGKENDREIKGEGNSYDFGARMFDPRVGRWFAPDILENKYPSWSTYNYTMDNPINFIDPDGKAVAAPPRNGIAQFIDNSGVYFWNTEKRTYEHYAYSDSSRKSYSFSGYYRATSASKVVGQATVIQNVQGEHTVTEPNNFLQNAQQWVVDNKESLLVLAKDIQKTGDAATTAGLIGEAAGSTVAGVGAAPGLTMAAVGGTTSLIGTGLEITVNFIAGDTNAATGAGIDQGISDLTGVAVDKLIPGPNPDVSPQVKELLEAGREIVKNKTGDAAKEISKKTRE